MSEFDEKLNAILNDQGAMNQIMALAHSLSGEKTEQSQNQSQEQNPEQQLPQAESQNQGPDLMGILSQVDPEMVRKGIELIQGVKGEDEKGSALLLALRPYLKEEKRERLDRAIQMARTMRLIRTAIGAISGKGESGGV